MSDDMNFMSDHKKFMSDVGRHLYGRIILCPSGREIDQTQIIIIRKCIFITFYLSCVKTLFFIKSPTRLFKFE